MGLFYVYEVVVVNGPVVEVSGVPGFVVFVFPNPQAGNDTARSAVAVLLAKAYGAMWVVGGVPRPLVAYIEAMRKFFCEEYPFEPVEVVGGCLTASQLVFEHDAVIAFFVFEGVDNIGEIGFVFDKAVAGYECAFFADAYPQVECACAAGDLLFELFSLATGEGLQEVHVPPADGVCGECVVRAVHGCWFLWLL